MASKRTPRDNTDNKVNEAKLKSRVKELEAENADLKRRLDELRKAKSTTVVKREREVVEVGQPFGRRDSKDTSKPTRDHDKKKDQEIEELKKQLSKAELDSKKIPDACGHEEIITQLQTRVAMLEADNAAFLIENEDLKECKSSLLNELSIKEAKVCDAEEQLEKQLEKKLQEKWKVMYGEWMAVTEKKIEELQAANAMLRRMIRPPRDGPSDSSTGS